MINVILILLAPYRKGPVAESAEIHIGLREDFMADIRIQRGPTPDKGSVPVQNKKAGKAIIFFNQTRILCM